MTIEAVDQFNAESGPVATPRRAGPPSAAPGSADSVDGAQALFAPMSVADTLDRVAGVARRMFGADGAGILLDGEGGAAPAAASGAQARRADTLQVDHHQGPGLQAIKGRQPVVSADLRFDGRWRIWAPQAADLGIRSVLSLALIDGDPFGAVTLYSQTPSYFGTSALAPGLRYAQQASMAITVAVEREQLLRAADARGVVGQAQGILMERYQISADQAFAVIRRASSTLNQKLRSIAERIIRGRSLPDIDLLALPHLMGATSIGGFDHDR